MTMPAEGDSPEEKRKNKIITITIVYDNNLHLKNFQNDWGFSCFIEGLEKSILFDTGGSSRILLDNMAKSGIEPEKIDGIFISHDHKDHTGGLGALMKKKREYDTWIPDFFSSQFKASLREKGANVIPIKFFGKLCEGAYTTGVINGWIKEQSLVLETGDSLVLVTGCAHPRIVHIVQTAKKLFKKDVRTILGGFHLVGFETNLVQEIIQTLKDESIQKAGPCHCSGEEARQLFARAFGENYLDLGVGKKIIIP
jgi:7,8-dihydropterin-6-yl-methyl-4-(beta-D-ribofuranosyl)aminobenzene 5'-phosphate synthase